MVSDDLTPLTARSDGPPATPGRERRSAACPGYMEREDVMPRFTKMSPADVAVGRGRAAAEKRKPHIEALNAGDAGSVELERGEKPAIVKRRLQEAARHANVRIRCSWTDSQQRMLVWKKVGTR